MFKPASSKYFFCSWKNYTFTYVLMEHSQEERAKYSVCDELSHY